MKRTIKKIPLKIDTTIDIYRFGGDENGILIVAGVHGNEVTGIYAARKLIELIEENGCETPVTIVPVANPIAFSCRTRSDPRDGLDLNRAFPYEDKEGPSHYIANCIWSLTKDATTLIDLHSSDHLSAIPYVVCLYDDEPSKKLAVSLDVETIVGGRENKGLLFAEAARSGIPSILIELAGEYGIYNEEQGEWLARILLDFLMNKESTATHNFYGNIMDVHSPKKGILRLPIEPGQKVKKDDVIAVIEEEEVFSEHSGIVLRTAEQSMIKEGERICSIALD